MENQNKSQWMQKKAPDLLYFIRILARFYYIHIDVDLNTVKDCTWWMSKVIQKPNLAKLLSRIESSVLSIERYIFCYRYKFCECLPNLKSSKKNKVPIKKLRFLRFTLTCSNLDYLECVSWKK